MPCKNLKSFFQVHFFFTYRHKHYVRPIFIAIVTVHVYFNGSSIKAIIDISALSFQTLSYVFPNPQFLLICVLLDFWSSYLTRNVLMCFRYNTIFNRRVSVQLIRTYTYARDITRRLLNGTYRAFCKPRSTNMYPRRGLAKVLAEKALLSESLKNLNKATVSVCLIRIVRQWPYCNVHGYGNAQVQNRVKCNIPRRLWR